MLRKHSRNIMGCGHRIACLTFWLGIHLFLGVCFVLAGISNRNEARPYKNRMEATSNATSLNTIQRMRSVATRPQSYLLSPSVPSTARISQWMLDVAMSARGSWALSFDCPTCNPILPELEHMTLVQIQAAVTRSQLASFWGYAPSIYTDIRAYWKRRGRIAHGPNVHAADNLISIPLRARVDPSVGADSDSVAECQVCSDNGHVLCIVTGFLIRLRTNLFIYPIERFRYMYTRRLAGFQCYEGCLSCCRYRSIVGCMERHPTAGQRT